MSGPLQGKRTERPSHLFGTFKYKHFYILLNIDGFGALAVFKNPRGMWLNSTSGILFVTGMGDLMLNVQPHYFYYSLHTQCKILLHRL